MLFWDQPNVHQLNLISSPGHTFVCLSQDKLPLAVVGSNTIMEVNGKRARGRQYPWGVAEGKTRMDTTVYLKGYSTLKKTSVILSSNQAFMNTLNRFLFA